MNKFLLSLCLLCCFSIASTHAQVAVKAGVNFANMLFEEDDDNIEDLAEDGSPKLMLGAVFIIPVGKLLAIQPEVLYVRKGSERSFTTAAGKFTNDITYDYIDVPLLLRLSLGDTYGESIGLYLNAGVYGGYVLNGKSVNETPLGNSEVDYTFDDQDNQQRVDFGLVGGAGLTLGNLFLELRYTHGTNNLLDDDADNSNDGKFTKLQHRGLGLSAGIIF